MSKILLINSSPLGDQSTSRKLAGELAEMLAGPDGQIIHRDVAAEPVLHLSAATLQAFMAGDGQVSNKGLDLSRRLIDELKASDVIVIASPMHNFSIPSTLKAWIDHICRAGETFHYTETGPVGRLSGKRAYIVAAKGGRYTGTDLSAMDFAVPYLTAVLQFIGVTDIETVEAEGLAMGPDAAADSIGAAQARITSLAA